MRLVSAAEYALLEKAAVDAENRSAAQAVRIVEFLDEQTRLRIEIAKRDTELMAMERKLGLALRQNTVLQTHLEWARITINTLNTERSQILARAYHLDLLVPEIAAVPTDAPATVSPERLERQERITENLTAHFEDMGDEAAAATGVEHGPGGTVEYRR